MLRPFNLIQKYFIEQIKTVAYIPNTEALASTTKAAATVATTKIGGAREMKEVRTLSKNKSAFSSLSCSTSGGSSFGDDEDIASENRGGRSPAPCNQYHLHHDIKLLPTDKSSTLLTTSKSCEGRLVARILPKEYAEYDSHKPATRMDPTSSIASILKWLETHDVSDGGGGDEGGSNNAQASLCQDDDEVVVLDLYILRKTFLDEQIDDNISLRREQRANALIGSYDLSRNLSSHARISTQDGSFPSVSNECRATQDGDLFSENIFHFRMNRASNELMLRTLRRLELSATRKLQSLRPLSNMRRKTNKGKEANLLMINKVTSSKLMVLSDESETATNGLEEADDVFDGYNCSEVDLTGLSSSDILRTVSSTGDCYCFGVALAIPKVILPWSTRDQAVNEEVTDDSTSISTDESSCTSVNFNALETVFLNITPNPPTVLGVQTYENFTAHVFVGVPLVIETTLIYATKAVITWFVNGQVVSHDSKMYSPSSEDVGKRISILITPVRPDHNGEACQEAYVFVNAVEPLPHMPIMELRNEWSRMDVVERDGCNNNLRVLTVSKNLQQAGPDILHSIVL
jgi:type IV secretory pathway VirB3-like protein